MGARFITALRTLSAMGALALSSTTALAAGANGDSQVILLTQLSFIQVDDMDLGLIIPGTTQGFVTLNPDGTRTATGGVVLAAGPTQPARFAGKGTNNQQVLISMSSNSINLTGPGLPMLLDTWTIGSTPTAVLSTTPLRFRINDALGIFNFPLGARLRVNANQLPGTYTGTFSINLVYQ